MDAMKKVTEYEGDIKSFNERQKKLLEDLEKTKDYNQVLSKTLLNLLEDEIFAKSLPH